MVTPPTRSVDPSLLFDKDLHQPYLDEYSVGYNRQFKGLMSVGVAWTHRRFHDNFGEVDINGIYPEQPSSRSLVSGSSTRTRGSSPRR